MQGAKQKIDEWNSFWEDVGFTIYDLLHHSKPEKGPLKDDDKWGGDLMENLINGVKAKEGNFSDVIKNVAENISDSFQNPVSFAGFEMPDTDNNFGDSFVDNIISSIQAKEKTIIDTIQGMIDNIKETFETPISLNTDVYAKGTLAGFEMPNILTNTNIPLTMDNYITSYNDTPNPPIYATDTTDTNNSQITVETLNINMEGMSFSSEYEMKKFIDFIADQLKAKSIRENRGIGGVMF